MHVWKLKFNFSIGFFSPYFVVFILCVSVAMCMPENSYGGQKITREFSAPSGS